MSSVFDATTGRGPGNPCSRLQHFLAGLRHLWMDVSHAAVSKEFGGKSAQAVLIASIVLTVILGAKLFGLY